MGFVVFVAGLAAVVVAIGAGMLWQERAGMPEPAVVYGVEDSIVWVWEGLDERTRASIDRSDVRRMLEWSVRWLQLPEGERGGPAVLGDAACAAYVQERCWEAGHAYEPELIFAVLELQASYLAALGALETAEEATKVDPEANRGGGA